LAFRDAGCERLLDRIAGMVERIGLIVAEGGDLR
jgi:hypothetical protein